MLGMEDNGFGDNYGIDQFDCSFEDFDIDQSIQSFSSESYNQNSFDQISPEQNNFSSSPIERPAKQLKKNSWNSYGTPNTIIDCQNQQQKINNNPKTSSNSLIISFDSRAVKPKNEVGTDENMILPSSSTFMNQYNTNTQYCIQGVKTKRVATSRTPLHALDHVIAERKRREKLSQRFIALSAVVPGLKKTDKASVLEDTIKYLKDLQNRVKTLEEQAAVKKTVESAVFVKKSHFSAEDNGSSLSDDETTLDSQYYSTEKPLPEIEARVQDKDVLIRIHCEKRKGCTVKLLDEIEKLDLTVVSTSVLPFGSFTLDISIVAKMGNDFSMTVKEIVRSLRQTY